MATIEIKDLPPLEELSPEEVEQILGAGRAKPGLESLEERKLMAASVIANLSSNFVLRVEGTNSADQIRVVEDRGFVRVQSNGQDVQIKDSRGKLHDVLDSQFVDKVEVHALIGDDQVTINVKDSAFVFGGSGNDRLENQSNVGATLDGGYHGDILIGGSGSDKLLGGSGWDNLDGRDGNDTLDGGTGDDVMEGGYGDDLMDGGDGNDNMHGSFGNDILRGGSGNDHMAGGDGDDRLEGGLGDDKLYGNDGNDILIGQEGKDHLDGGKGSDKEIQGY